jgi:cytochrome o ubiquinol oxidase subunit 2
MPDIKNKKQVQRPPVDIILLALTFLVLTIIYFVKGTNVALFNPKGFIAHEQRGLIVLTVTVLLVVVIPTLTIAYLIAWRYRDTNTRAKQESRHRHPKLLVASFWLIPAAVMVVLASVMWPATHRLAPQKTLASNTKPLTIQVISLRWKWLFIYPREGVATVNFVQLPKNTPVTFEMTADETPMSSFWIPNLGGQLYTMTSHVNRLNLMATETGDYRGSTPEINGMGFAGMKFTARVSSGQDFNDWVQSVKQSTDTLDTKAYQSLLKPSEYNPVALYASFEPTLYASVITKYEGPGGHHH